MKRVIEHTADGSATLFIPEMDEHYHSIKGARTESQHIFVDMGLKATEKDEVRILEVGFGTGLNAILTLENAKILKKHVRYTGIELYPLEWEVVKALDYSQTPEFELLHTAPWQQETIINANFALLKLHSDINTMFIKRDENSIENLYQLYDIVYFDAFAPEKQPEMWSQELFDAIYQSMSHNGILTTYCAKGVVRRMLQASGFIVERLQGPPGGKREILRATKK